MKSFFKSKNIIFLISIVLVLLIAAVLVEEIIVASFALANDWTYTQNFEGLNDNDLPGQDGWSGYADVCDVLSTSTSHTGSKSVNKSGNQNCYKIVDLGGSNTHVGGVTAWMKEQSA